MADWRRPVFSGGGSSGAVRGGKLQGGVKRNIHYIRYYYYYYVVI
jgi:hypothetical protein